MGQPRTEVVRADLGDPPHDVLERGTPGDIVCVGAVGRPVLLLPGGVLDLGVAAVVACDGQRMAAVQVGDMVSEEMDGSRLAAAGKQEPRGHGADDAI